LVRINVVVSIEMPLGNEMRITCNPEFRKPDPHELCSAQTARPDDNLPPQQLPQIAPAKELQATSTFHR